MKLLQLNQFNGIEWGVADSFDRLPHTEHKDGAYRLRRYSVVELRTTFWNALQEAEITRLSHRDFEQSEDLNKHQGGVARSFEEIEDDVLQSRGMKEICMAFRDTFDLVDGQEIEIHQMRVVTCGEKFGDKTPVSPEGIHQDGFDYIAMVGVDRKNILGGELMVYRNKDDEPIVVHALNSGEIIMLRDNELWHNATPIQKVDKSYEGYGDWFVLCAKK